MTLYRETSCEHGELEAHQTHLPSMHEGPVCPGGSREEVTIDYEAAVIALVQGQGHMAARQAKGVVDAALRVTEDVR